MFSPKSLLRAVCVCIAASLTFVSCSKNDDTGPKATGKSIASFTFMIDGKPVASTITDSVITLLLPVDADMTAIVPVITLSDKAKVSPASGEPNDFSKNKKYTVTAEDGSIKVYTIVIKDAPAETKIIECSNIPTSLPDLGTGIDYIIKCSVAITDGKVVTIKPGVTIQFEGEDAGFIITKEGALKMKGTAAKPIILQGKTATAGTWTGIQMDSRNSENQWEYVTLRDAGAGKNAAGLLIADNAYFLHNTIISIKNCKFINNKGYGIWDVDNGFPYQRIAFTAFEKNTFSDNTTAPMSITMDDMGLLDVNSTFTNNGQNWIEVHGDRGLRANTTVQKLSIPYLIVGNIPLNQRLKVSPGVTFLFYTDAAFTLDQQWNGTGTLIANGTSSNPIKFAGYKSGKGIWMGLSLGNNDPEIVLNYCTIDGAGSNLSNNSGCIGNEKAAVNFFPSCNAYTVKPVVTNCKITNSGGYGLVYKKNATPTFTNNTFSNITLNNEKAF